MKKEKRQKQQPKQEQEISRTIGARFEEWADEQANNIRAGIRGGQKLGKALAEAGSALTKLAIAVLIVIGTLGYYWSAVASLLQ